MKKISLLAILLVVAGCSAFDDAEYKVLRELASPEGTITVSEDGGKAEFTVYSNGDVVIDPQGAKEAGAEVTPLIFTGDSKVTVTFGPNTGLQRMVSLYMTLDGGDKRDTLYARQEGEEAVMECSAPFKLVDGTKEATTSFGFNTNLSLSDADKSINYLSGAQGWIKSIRVEKDAIIVETIPTGSTEVSRANIEVSCIDGWGNVLQSRLFLTCSDNKGEFGTKISFEEVHSLSGEVKDALCLEGVVTSDYHSANQDVNPMVAYNLTDITESARTAYIQAADGSSGLRLKFNAAEDNVLVPGATLTLNLYGATVSKDEGTASWTIEGLSAESVIKTEDGATVIEKTRRIDELTDSDIYTFVTIPNVEFACKFGSYSNVCEYFTLKSEVNADVSKCNGRIDGWAVLMVDGEGHAIYAPVNLMCTWRRSGNGVPQGRGSLKGTVVSNTINRYGNLGRYQIRVLDESGFGQDKSGEGAYKLIAEWDGAPYQYRFSQYTAANPKYEYKKLDSVIPSDDISKTNPDPIGELTVENKVIGSNTSWPIGSDYAYSYLLATDATFGSWPSKPVADYRKALMITTEIKGWFKWNADEIVGYNGVRAEISTKGLSGTSVQVHYAFSVGRTTAVTSQYFPAHWCTEYSTDGGNTWTLVKDAATSEDYVHLRSLPWWDATIGGVLYRCNSHCCPGATEHVCYLPADALGLDKLVVRIRPYDNVMAIFPSEYDAEIETARILSNTSASSTTIQFDYLRFSYR